MKWSLSFKVVTWSAVVGTLISGIFWYRSLRGERGFLTESAADDAAAYADLVKKSVRDHMLADDREGIHKTLAAITGTESLRSVQIYDRLGRVVFSSSPANVGRRAGRTELPCLGCHDDPTRPRETLRGTRRYAIFRDPGGRRVLSYVEPLYNEPACSAAACHAHPEEVRVLGVLLADFPLTRLERRVDEMVANFSLFVMIYIVTLGGAGYLLVWRLVLRPVGALTAGVERVAAGDLSHPVPVAARDELGRLADAVNSMIGELAAARGRAERWTQSLEEEVAKKSTEIRSTEAKLAEAAKLAALGRLTAELAHEIRNPLTALGGYGRRLQRAVRSPEEREAARIVVEEASRLEGLLKDVLDYTRPPRPAFRLASLAQIVEQSLAAFALRCAEAHIWVASDLAAEASAPVDESQVRRAVDNLLMNAIDAMPRGGTLAVSVRLDSEGGAGYAVVRVEDTGTGIAAEDLPRIFEPFWTTKKMGGGTGLGLPITRAIAEAHGGFIRVENRDDGGLSASLWFPVSHPAGG
jgi:two-component system NtrC family sensor kinase